MTIPDEQFFTLEEVAERLRVDVQTVRRWIKAGKLAAYKPGREYRIPPSALEDFLENHSYPKVQAPLSPSEDAPDERRIQEELATALAAKLAERGEYLEEEIKASAEGLPLTRVSRFFEDYLSRELNFELLALQGPISEELREAKERLDAMAKRIDKLASQFLHDPVDKAQVENQQEFAKRRAGILHSEEADSGTRIAGEANAG